MLASMAPVGEAARGNRWRVTATAYIAGSVAGGVATGAALGAVGGLLVGIGERPAMVVLVAAAVAGLVLDRRGVPSLRRQVDERWLTTYRGWVYGAGFGFQLGTGLTTTVRASATYVTLLGALLSGSWQAGAVVAGVFGGVRALPLLATAGLRTPRALRALHRRLHDWTRPVARATAAVQASVAGAAVALLLGIGA